MPNHITNVCAPPFGSGRSLFHRWKKQDQYVPEVHNSTGERRPFCVDSTHMVQKRMESFNQNHKSFELMIVVMRVVLVVFYFVVVVVVHLLSSKVVYPIFALFGCKSVLD